MRDLLEGLRLDTVCREARCPNLPECWSAGTATLMLLGTECTRRCAFCAVTTHWPRGAVDRTEPERVARAVAEWGLRYVVLTQVCRDDLPDGGADLLSETVRSVRRASPKTKVELLAGDLGGTRRPSRPCWPNLRTSSLITSRRCARSPRPSGIDGPGTTGLSRVLRRARETGAACLVLKSSIMLGLGESPTEVETAMADLRGAGVDLVTFGQYLRPSPAHLPVVR